MPPPRFRFELDALCATPLFYLIGKIDLTKQRKNDKIIKESTGKKGAGYSVLKRLIREALPPISTIGKRLLGRGFKNATGRGFSPFESHFVIRGVAKANKNQRMTAHIAPMGVNAKSFEQQISKTQFIAFGFDDFTKFFDFYIWHSIYYSEK